MLLLLLSIIGSLARAYVSHIIIELDLYIVCETEGRSLKGTIPTEFGKLTLLGQLTLCTYIARKVANQNHTFAKVN